MTRRWRMGLIGCGWAGEQHVRAMRTLAERVELCAVADNEAEVAKTKAEEWHVPVWTEDYHDLLAAEELDAVSLCLPHHLHAPAAVEAMEAGLHVLVEKPLATTLVEADAMIAAARTNGVRLMVAETARFDATYTRVSELVGEGVLGNLFLIRISREHQMHQYLRQRPWFLSEASGGIMYSGGIHDFEILRMIGGEIEHVYALPGPKVLLEMAADDTSVALVGMASGAAAVIAESFSLRTPQPGVQGTVHGGQGSLWFGNGRIQIYRAGEDGRPEAVEEISVPARDAFQAEIVHFLDCLDNRKEPLTSGEEERKPLVAVLAAYESMRTGKRVYLGGREYNGEETEGSL